jgi:hypothetical protein
MDSDIDEYHGINSNNNNYLSDNRSTTTENRPLILRSLSNSMEASDHHDLVPWSANLIDDVEYAEIIKQAERAIEGGILPVRIASGSSGSYFVRNLEGVGCYFHQKIQKFSFC